MWQKLKAFLSSIPRIPISRRNLLFITADIKGGIILVSYKKRVKKGKFADDTLSKMMKGVRFEDNVSDFLAATGKLINQVRK